MLQLSQPLKVWERIEIQVGDGENTGRYLARIQDFVDNGIAITEPEFLAGRSLLREDVPVTVVVTRQDAAYQFQSRIKSFSAHDRRRFVLTGPSQIERVQRRRFVRLDVVSKLTYAVIPVTINWAEADYQLTWHHSQSADLSAGGIRFRVHEPLAVGSLMALSIDLFKQHGLPPRVAAVVRRNAQVDQELAVGAEFILAEQLPLFFKASGDLPAEFLSFDMRMQNELVTCIFRAQIELRRKGLL
ncbi:MAG: PilZ domain-containing protein [Candidatus Zixiibacteriota bacterium]